MATNEVAQNWIAQDQQAASQWVDTLPPSPARDSAAMQLVTVSLSQSPSTAFQWAASIGSDPIRSSQINRVVNTWALTDPTAAAAAVQNANLTDEQKTAILNKIQRVAAAASN